MTLCRHKTENDRMNLLLPATLSVKGDTYKFESSLTLMIHKGILKSGILAYNRKITFMYI